MRTIATLLTVVGLSAGACSASAQTQSVTGQVIDLYCYSMNKEDVGMDHRTGRGCAMSCVRYDAHPAGLLTSDGKVFQLTGGLAANSNAKIWPHLGHTVTVRGSASIVDGMPTLAANDVTMAK